MLGTGRAIGPAALPARPLGHLAGAGRLVRARAPPRSGPDRGGGAASSGRSARRAAGGRRPDPRGGGPSPRPGGGGRRRSPTAMGARVRLGARDARRGGDRHGDGRARRARRPGAAARIDRPGAERDLGAGLERAGRGPGQDHRPAPGARGALRQRLRRLPAGRGVPARRRAPRPVPLRSASASRWACNRATTTRPRSATSSTPAWRCRGGASSSPTATATRTGPPKRPRPSSTTSGSCSSRARERSAAAPSPRSSTASARLPPRPSWRGRSPRWGPGADPHRLLEAAGAGGIDRRAESGPAWRPPAPPRPQRGARDRSRTRP